ncbi:MAG: hypothetical protein JO025_02235 [Verrucomicrobia bacterium]|nr:hypothetical protein [Verrucomicrobiota bacterium]
MNAAKDHAADFLNYLGWYEKAKSANNPLEVARFALQAVSEIHLIMGGRNDRGEAVRIMHGILGPFLVGGGQDKTGDLYDRLRNDARLRPAI